MRRHSWQAFILIQTIHLMNFTEPVTLAPIIEDVAREGATI
jgi:hypothetical protein